MQTRLQVEAVRKEFGRGVHTVVAVNDVSFDIASGETLALLGPNGAGKTTTVKMACGLITPTGGRISVCGLDAVRKYRQAVGCVGAVLEGSRNVYWRLTVTENLEYFAYIRGKAGPGLQGRITHLLEVVGLSERRNDPAQTLSRGMQQRLSIACALVGDPRILLLDEPTLGLDFESSEMIKTEIRRLARNEGKAVLLTTHQMELAQALADRVGIISHGRLVALDPLERLRHLFAFGQYEVHLNGALPAEKRTALQRWESSVRESDGQTSVIVALDDPHHLYTLLEAVRPCPIAYVKRVEPDLAEIYLKVLEKETPNGRLAGVDR